MTTLTNTTAAQTKPSDRFLRNALRVDAVASALTGAISIAAPGLQEELYGLPRTLTLPVGRSCGPTATATIWRYPPGMTSMMSTLTTRPETDHERTA